jgi:hypothetical protein
MSIRIMSTGSIEGRPKPAISVGDVLGGICEFPYCIPVRQVGAEQQARQAKRAAQDCRHERESVLDPAVSHSGNYQDHDAQDEVHAVDRIGRVEDARSRNACQEAPQSGQFNRNEDRSSQQQEPAWKHQFWRASRGILV